MGRAQIGPAAHGYAGMARRGTAWRSGEKLGYAGVAWLGKSGFGVSM
jgi:hypothetical protein